MHRRCHGRSRATGHYMGGIALRMMRQRRHRQRDWWNAGRRLLRLADQVFLELVDGLHIVDDRVEGLLAQRTLGFHLKRNQNNQTLSDKLRPGECQADGAPTLLHSSKHLKQN